MHKAALLPVSIAALTLLFGTSCKKDEPMQILDLGYGYFPTDTGRWVEYEVDSTWYDELNGVNGHVNYRLREVIAENFTDPEGRPAQRVKRYVQDSLGVWNTRDVWWQTRDNYAAEKTEENLRRLKMSFPVSLGRYWDVNIYNPDANEVYPNEPQEIEVGYHDIGDPWSVNGMSFDSTVTVDSDYPNNLVDTLIWQERYAKHVGMIEKFYQRSKTDIQYPQGLPPIISTLGMRLRMTVVAHGG
jgi:hypothetical protein